MPSTAIDGELNRLLKVQFPHIDILSVARKYFSETKG